MNKTLEIKIVSSDTDYAKAMAVREHVFIEEQGIPKSKEFDGNDHSATHILALAEDEPVGTMRIRYFNGFVKFERMCVLPSFRKTDVSEQIMQKGMRFCAEKGYNKVYGVCKKELLPRWKRNGFEPVPNVSPTIQNGMTLVPVMCPLPKTANCISLETAPEILNAKEGEWFSDKTEKELLRVKKLLSLLKASDQKSLPAKAPYADQNASVFNNIKTNSR